MTEWIDKLSEDDQNKAKHEEMPDWMDPMLAKLTYDYFSGEDWIFERKLDGERVLAYVDEDQNVNLKSRNQKNLNDSYPEIQEALSSQAKASCILDGEVVAFNHKDLSDFHKLQPRMHASSREESLESDIKVYYYLFDCLFISGYDVTGCSLDGRKKLLKDCLDYKDPLRLIKYRKDDGLAYYQEACQKGWEGLIAKHAGSTYVPSRSSKWLKFKCVMQQEFVIGGLTEPQGERIGFGALLLGFYRNGDLIYAGKVGTGFDDETLQDLRASLDSITRQTSPFDEGHPETKNVQFVTPKLICEVAFTEWTDEDRLRHPRYKGMRRDKDIKDVHKEEES